MAVRASIPKGTRDFLPATLAKRQYVLDEIARVYRSYGYQPLETPSIENLQTLEGKYGDEGDQLIFKILKRGAKAATGECDLGLRYDLTVPLARVVAMHQNDLPPVFKRYQMQPVWRADRPAKGRFREFFQCDIDIVNAKPPLAEIDLLSALIDAFDALGFSDTQVRLNDRRVLSAMVAAAGVPQDLEVTAIVAIDKLDKIGRDGVASELENRGIEADAAVALLNMLDRLEATDTRIDLLTDELKEETDGLAGVASLAEIVGGLTSLGLGARVTVDPSLARGLNYYTGAIFEVTVPDLNGSLAGGGRYDGLIGMFAGRDIPSIGVSMGLERILVVMEERGLFPEDVGNTPDVVVVNFGSATRDATLKAARTLRDEGLVVDLYPNKAKMKKQFAYADGVGASFVAIVGPDEAENGQIKLKNLKTGTQEVMTIEETCRALRDQIQPS